MSRPTKVTKKKKVDNRTLEEMCGDESRFNRLKFLWQDSRERKPFARTRGYTKIDVFQIKALNNGFRKEIIKKFLEEESV